jgi:CubicO group peptidase (beta-lactamase class C family)
MSLRLKATLKNIGMLDSVIEPMLRAARIPGAAIAVVADGEIVFANGYGYRDLERRLPMTPKTIYPIASTTKAFNATLLGMLVDEGEIAWDSLVQDSLPRFQLHDRYASMHVTIRDLITMRTGLPRHDWVWNGQLLSRTDLVERIRHLELSAGFRERFQYNNITVTVAGHIAEVISERSWEDLVRQRILEPLGMGNTGFSFPNSGDVSLSYHENEYREIITTKRLVTDVTAPSGGSIHSNVMNMARWASFNLRRGGTAQPCIIKPSTLAEIQSPQMTAGSDPTAPTPNAAYGMGWFLDTYNGRARMSHSGYLHDVNSEISLFPADGIGIISFINFGCPRIAGLINEHAFDLLKGFEPAETLDQKMDQYEDKLRVTRERNAAVPHISNAAPSHALGDYDGAYSHPAYGTIVIDRTADELIFRRQGLVIPLQHWHYDSWTARKNDMFHIHMPHAFDRASHFMFDTNSAGAVAAVTIPLEPAVGPIRFDKRATVCK